MKVPASLPTKPIKLAIVGEAPGAEEDMEGKPFIGQSGKLLTQLLISLGVSRDECLITNVFSTRPPANNIAHFFIGPGPLKEILKAEGLPTMDIAAILAGDRPHPTVHSGMPRHPEYGFLKKEHAHEIDRLYRELAEQNPPVVMALGGTALFALTHLVGISAHRGTFNTTVTSHRCIASYHPAAVLRDWSMRPILHADLRKALYPPAEVVRHIHIAESPQDIADFIAAHCPPGSTVALDVETESLQITCLSIAASPQHALVVPIWNPANRGLHHWSAEDEFLVWEQIHKLMFDPARNKLFQNALYDLTYLFDHGIIVRGEVHDTMLMHHVLQPEMAKSLGFLGSLYCNAPAWKTLRVKTKHAVNKKDE